MIQLPNVNAQLERMKEVLKMDLSTVVQKVSLDHISIANLTWKLFFQLMDSDLTCPPCWQGFSSLNDTPHMVTEQTRSVVESTFGKAPLYLFIFSWVLCSGPFVDTDRLTERSVTQMCRVWWMTLAKTSAAFPKYSPCRAACPTLRSLSAMFTPRLRTTTLKLTEWTSTGKPTA